MTGEQTAQPSDETLLPGIAPAAPTPVRKWTPIRTALFLTVGLRLFYSIFAAAFSPFLTLDPGLIARSSFTENLMQRGSHPALYALLGVWERFDTLWYIRIAHQGYDSPLPSVFYPLYPALIRIASLVTRSDLISGLLVSTLATFFMCWGALLLFELDFSPRTAFRALLLWLAWPDAFILFAPYPESLLLALILWSLYFARKGDWRLAGTLGFFAGLAKALGCFTALPLLYIGWKRRDRRCLAAAVASGSGTALFQLFLRARGFPSPTQVYENFWSIYPSAPWLTVMDAWHALAKGNDALLVLNSGALLAVAVLIFARRVPVEYQIFSLASIILFLTKRYSLVLSSSIRYSLCAFAAFPSLARCVDGNLGFMGAMVMMEALNLFLFRVYLDWSLVI